MNAGGGGTRKGGKSSSMSSRVTISVFFFRPLVENEQIHILLVGGSAFLLFTLRIHVCG